MNPKHRWRAALPLILFPLWVHAQATNIALRPVSPDANGWFRLASDGYLESGNGSATGLVYTVDASSNLSNWVEIARLHRFPEDTINFWSGSRLPFFTNLFFTDPASDTKEHRFYRLRAHTQEAMDWKNQLGAPWDDFSSSMQSLSWVKFAIATNEPARVYFARSSAYELHYRFVTNRIPGFANLSQAEVDSRSQYNTNRQLYLGTVLQPWDGWYPLSEFGIQLVGRDPIPPAKVLELTRLVRAAVLSAPDMRVTYVPTLEQAASAEANRAFFTSNGVPVRRAEDWIRADTCYSAGWTIGRLVFVTATNVADAYANGALLPTDILLTDGVPAELPYVSGIITLAAATPNSHVAILAQSYQVPFVYLADAALREKVVAMTNRDIALQVTLVNPPELGPCRALMIPLDPDIDPALKTALLAYKQPAPLSIRRKERFGAYASPTTNLTPEDARFFGGKVANFGLLRRIVPTNSPTPSVAFSMDLWDDFMEQPSEGGLPLRAVISNRLSSFTYPANVASVKTALASIRSLIRNQSHFTTAQEQAILAALSPFSTNRNIRFRSSSNVEDADYFSGAGLYDSFSGCSADDLTGNAGPSICDPTEDGPRGVFRAMRRVYASFYNDNAFLERLRLRVNEWEVGMGMLAHYSAPDDTEMANGVAAVGRANGVTTARLVTQAGAVSITNPDGASAPEEVYAADGGSAPPYLALRQSSSLVILGDHVMSWPGDYENLADMLFRISSAYGAGVLDFEYKKLQPGKLEIKQVREVPTPQEAPLIPGYILNQKLAFASSQQSISVRDLSSAHRLKSRWTFQTRSLQFTSNNLNAGFITGLSVEQISGDRVVTNTFSTLSNLTYRVEEPGRGSPTLVYSWRMNSAAGPANFELKAWHSYPFVSARENPVLDMADSRFHFHLSAEYDDPVWYLVAPDPPGHNDYAALAPMLTNSATEVFREAVYDQGGAGPTNATIHARYYIGNNHVYAGDPPFYRFEETEITGLTSRPIILRGYFSQTWYAGHRQGVEWFLFEPRLEEGIDPALLAELEAKNIRAIFLEMINETFDPRPNRMATFSSRAFGPF